MNKNDDDDRKSAPAASASYEIGRGKPPVATRFAKGQSGNPNGRPKGARNKIPATNEERLKEIILEEAYRDIRINDGDRQVTVPMVRAIVRAIAMGAAKGQPRAQVLFTTLLATIEQERKELHENWLDAMMVYKLRWEKEIDRCKELGLAPPALLLHPDHIVIDLVNGTAHVKEPTPEEKALAEKCQAAAEAMGWACPSGD